MNEDRIELLEDRVLELEHEIAQLKGQRARPRAVPQVAPATSPPPVRSQPIPAPTPRREPLSFEEILSPRNLAIAGAIAVLAGLVFLVSYGISNGWISEEVRVIGAAIFSVLLAAAGVYLREVKKLAAPAETLVVVGLAGLFISLVAATRLYDLIDPVTALAMSAVIGIVGLAIGAWWRSEVVAASVLCASLLAPLMVGADYTPGLLAFLIPVFTAAVAAAVLRPWPIVFPVTAFLFLASLIAAVADAEQGSVLAAYGLALITLLLITIGSVGRLLIKGGENAEREVIFFGLFFAAVTLIGTFLVTGSEQPLVQCLNEGSSDCSTNLTTAGALWLMTSTVIGAGIWWLARERELEALSITAFALGATSLAAALGFFFDGSPLLTAAWSVEAACLIALGVTQWQRLVGMAALGLAMIAALVEVPLSILEVGSTDLVHDLGVIAPLLIPLTLLAWREKNELGEVSSGVAVAVAAWMGVLLCGSLTEPTGLLNLVPICLAAALPICLVDRVWTQACLIWFGAVAVVFALATAIPPDALVNGVPSAPEALGASVMLIAVAAATATFGSPTWRKPAAWTAIGLGIYTISFLIVDGFQGGTETSGELSTEAQGQVIVSSLWALTGLGLVVAGLIRQHLSWRKAGLILLVLSLAKISLYDLASLSTAGRTISFILVGLVLLAAAFAYQWMNRRTEAP